MSLSPDWVSTHLPVACISSAFRSLAIVCTALLAYDVLINLAREKRLVWDETFRPSSVLYYLTRYPVVAYQIFNVVYTWTTPQVSFTTRSMG